jgi:hypothetical protein
MFTFLPVVSPKEYHRFVGGWKAQQVLRLPFPAIGGRVWR